MLENKQWCLGLRLSVFYPCLVQETFGLYGVNAIQREM